MRNPRAEDAAVRRAEEDADKVRSFGDFRYAAKSWKEKERRVIARIEAPLFSREGAGQRYALYRHQPQRLTENELNDFNRLWLVVVGNHDWIERWPGARRVD